MKCDICGMEVKNLGAHKYQKHRELMPTGVVVPLESLDEIKIDVPSEKPLSEIVNEVKDLLKRYRFTVKVSYEEEDVNISNIEILARFQVRR